MAADAVALDGRGRELAREHVGDAQGVRARGLRRKKGGGSGHGDQNAGTIEPANFSDTKLRTSGDW